MQIIGKKYLDDNMYDSISIYEDKIIICSSISLSTMEMSYKISDEFDGKSNSEIINLIVDLYLRYNKVNYITHGECLSLEGKRLKFHILNDEYIKKRIKDNYEYNRLNYLIENSENECKVKSLDSISYYTKDNNYSLASVDGHLLNEELYFLSQMIETIFESDLAYYTNVNGYENNHMEIISLKDNNKVIRINNNLVKNYNKEICDLISNHNKKISNKNLLLKLEV